MKLGLLSDAHGNLEAFDRALVVLEAEGVDDVYFLGDAIGYLPGIAVVSRIRELGLVATLGNHEAMLLAGGADPAREEHYQLEPTRRLLSDDDLAAISAWPHLLDVAAPGGAVRLMHGSPADPVYGYVYPDTDVDEFSPHEPGLIQVTANTHRPFVRDLDDGLLVNCGSCGLPRDHGELGAVAIVDTERRSAEIVRFSIADALDRAFARMRGVSERVQALRDRRPDHALVGRMVDV